MWTKRLPEDSRCSASTPTDSSHAQCDLAQKHAGCHMHVREDGSPVMWSDVMSFSLDGQSIKHAPLNVSNINYAFNGELRVPPCDQTIAFSDENAPHPAIPVKVVTLTFPGHVAFVDDIIAQENAAKRGNMPYGYCPKCSGEVVEQERRMNGNDTCCKGHVFPSSQTLKQPKPVAGAPKRGDAVLIPAEIVRVDGDKVLVSFLGHNGSIQSVWMSPSQVEVRG